MFTYKENKRQMKQHALQYDQLIDSIHVKNMRSKRYCFVRLDKHIIEGLLLHPFQNLISVFCKWPAHDTVFFYWAKPLLGFFTRITVIKVS